MEGVTNSVLKNIKKIILPKKIPPERDTLIYPQAKTFFAPIFIEWTQNTKRFYWRWVTFEPIHTLANAIYICRVW